MPRQISTMSPLYKDATRPLVVDLMIYHLPISGQAMGYRSAIGLVCTSVLVQWPMV